MLSSSICDVRSGSAVASWRRRGRQTPYFFKQVATPRCDNNSLLETPSSCDPRSDCGLLFYPPHGPLGGHMWMMVFRLATCTHRCIAHACAYINLWICVHDSTRRCILVFARPCVHVYVCIFMHLCGMFLVYVRIWLSMSVHVCSCVQVNMSSSVQVWMCMHIPVCIPFLASCPLVSRRMRVVKQLRPRLSGLKCSSDGSSGCRWKRIRRSSSD